MKKSYLLVGTSFLTLLAASANATVITFDDLSEGDIVSNQYAGVTFTSGPGSLNVPNNGGNGFATTTSLDVTLSTGANVGGGVTSPISGNLLHGFDGWLGEDGDGVFVITFANAITAISMDFGGVFNTASTGIYAFAGGSNPVASATTTATGTSTVSLTGLSGVTQVAVTIGDFNDWVGVDNINYTTDSVPEPASLAVLGLGALAMVRRRKK